MNSIQHVLLLLSGHLTHFDLHLHIMNLNIPSLCSIIFIISTYTLECSTLNSNLHFLMAQSDKTSKETKWDILTPLSVSLHPTPISILTPHLFQYPSWISDIFKNLNNLKLTVVSNEFFSNNMLEKKKRLKRSPNFREKSW